MSQKIQQRRTKYIKFIDDVFHECIGNIEKNVNRANTNRKLIDQAYEILKSSPNNVAQIEDLRKLTNLMAMITYQNVISDINSYEMVMKIKEVIYLFTSTSLELLKTPQKTTEERVVTLEQEFERFKKQKEKIEIKVPKKFKKIFEKIVKQIEEAERAQEKYTQ